MNEQKVQQITETLDGLKKRMPILTQDKETIGAMLELMMRPFLVALIENNKSFPEGTISVEAVIQQVLEVFSQTSDFPANIAEDVKARYHVDESHAIDWAKEITFTSFQYNHPLTKLHNFVFSHLSPEGQAVVAMQSLQAIS